MASADAPTGAGTGPAPQTDTSAEDTLDLPLSEELLGLLRDGTRATATAAAPLEAPDAPGPSGSSSASSVSSATPPVSSATPPVSSATPPVSSVTAASGGADPTGAARITATGTTVPRTPESGGASAALLDRPADWGPVNTPAGVFQLVPVRLERDLALISRWMNDPAVAAFWELAGAETVTADHLRPQLDGDGRSVPCLGVLAGIPMSYWEIYRADLDPLARHYPARPHDTGIHLLIGGVDDRGRGVGTTLLRAVADLILDHRPLCGRVVAEPDLRNTPSVSAFLSAGFRFSAEVELPGKRAALMVRDRTHRAHL
ncbi:GNAT family N-acetyltransferase [Streptomyces sp. NPDC002476]|uniref:GNAT family N-acetyltransferase n=1 Tax=Streptomyces sp. NPDC002476 TaxID=3364648 RepID=UPI003680F94E